MRSLFDILTFACFFGSLTYFQLDTMTSDYPCWCHSDIRSAMYCLRYALSKTSEIANRQRRTELSPATGTKQILDTRVQPQQLNLLRSRHGYKLIATEKEKRLTTLE
jgi:hypothetical protein